MKSSKPVGFEDFFVLDSSGSQNDTRGVFMVLIKVQYDGYNRQFKLVDRELAHMLEDGESYMLIADISLKDLETKQGTEIQSHLFPVTA